jgi:mRNA-degrading endonuclease YafQ of YafQ-DinJ toxin-antitoxin module
MLRLEFTGQFKKDFKIDSNRNPQRFVLIRKICESSVEVYLH